MTQGAMAMPNTWAFSSFGAENTTMGPQFRARWVCSNDRFRELDRRQSYYDCTQHDWKQFDFDGRVIRPGPPTQQPLLSAEQSPHYIPLKSRRPSSPYRLARIITNSFTNLIFGEGRFPQVRIEGDPDSQDFLEALIDAAALPVRMIQARNMGGSTGAVGMSWCFREGRPCVLVHNPKHVHIHSWLDRDMLAPEHVTEIYYYPEDVWDSTKKAYIRKWFWYRRDWTPDSDLVFQPIEFRGDRDPVWVIDTANSVQHDDGTCHFVWIQNLPTDDVDGLPDYHGLYENFDSIDTVLSVLNRGTTLNLDPTLVLHMDLDYVQRMGVKKGSDNALVVGEAGSAEYLELSGQAATAGITLFTQMRKTTLEVAQCVVADPDQVTSTGVSSVALKVVYAPMLSKCDVYRSQYGEGLRRLLNQMLTVAKAKMGKQTDDGKTLSLNLPPRVEKEPKLDDDGQDTGEFNITRTDRKPGEGGFIDLQWGSYFTPTPDDQSKMVTTLNMATGGKAFVSPQTATELAASAFGLNADEENRRMANQKAADKAQQDAMMQGMGGQVDGQDSMPPGATPPKPPVVRPPGVPTPMKPKGPPTPPTPPKPTPAVATE